MRLVLIERNVCPCGSSTVCDDVPKFTEYYKAVRRDDRLVIAKTSITCGACKAVWSGPCILVEGGIHDSTGFLPLELFGAIVQEPELAAETVE